jgi:hypothetical protein
LGTYSCNFSGVLNKSITTFRGGENFIKGYRFEAFKEDYMLGQQFSFEDAILTNADEAGCKNIVKLRFKNFCDAGVLFFLEAYEMDLRVYL